MKFVCNKQITGVVSVSNFGNFVSVDIDGKPLADVAAKDIGIPKDQSRTFPAHVVMVIEDLSGEEPCIPDPEEAAKKILDMIRMVENDARSE